MWVSEQESIQQLLVDATDFINLSPWTNTTTDSQRGPAQSKSFDLWWPLGGQGSKLQHDWWHLFLQTSVGMLSVKHMTHRKCLHSNSYWTVTKSEGFFGLLAFSFFFFFYFTDCLLSSSLTTQTNSVLLGWREIILSLTEVLANQAKRTEASCMAQVYVRDSQSKCRYAMNGTDDCKLFSSLVKSLDPIAWQ